MADVGDTPHTAEEATLVDHDSGTAHNRPVEGDKPVLGEVHLVEDTSTVKPATAAEMRALGYPVPADLADDAVPTGVIPSDQPLEAGKVNLYIEEPAYPGGPPPEEPELKVVDAPVTASAVSDPTPEQQGARTPEEQAAADEAAADAHEAEDPNYQAGRTAALAGQPRSSNPNDGRKAEGRTWFRGYDSVEA